MKRPVFLITLAILLAGLVLFGLSDTAISIADTSVPNNEATSRVSETAHSNSSASATITITMNALPDE